MDFYLENVEISLPPRGLEKKFADMFTLESVSFLTELTCTFQHRTTQLLRQRKLRKLTQETEDKLPTFSDNPKVTDKKWKIAELPSRLKNRHLDLGDVSPSNAEHFKKALCSSVQGIQVDFDDGHCPTWSNMITGLHNVIAFTKGKFCPDEVPRLCKAPILMLRPRAWNMNEHNFMVKGKEIPGALLDFGLLMFHTAKTTSRKEVGPFFYLPKVESSREAQLWNDIFIWTQHKLGIPTGTIKACVLIENILASFEMDEILYELREHSLGLNCGIWDYCASFINKFGSRKEFLLPDRNKYVNLEKHFLESYMKLVVKTCHKRGAPATGGMAAQTLKNIKTSEDGKTNRMEIVEKVCKGKLREIHLGVDGFMVYDSDLVPWMNDLWGRFGSIHGHNQISTVTHSNLKVKPSDLLKIPKGGVTLNGLKHNIKVSVLFIYSWLANGKGHFYLDGVVEDSATAEISRSQIWQWIYHEANLEDSSRNKINKSLVRQLTNEFQAEEMGMTNYELHYIETACQLFLEIVTATEFPEFITTYLYNHSLFRARHNT